MSERPTIEDALRIAADTPNRSVTIRLAGYVRVRCMFDLGEATVQLMDRDAEYTITGDVPMLWHMVQEIATVGSASFRERHLHMLQAQAYANYELEQRLDRLERELRTNTRLLRMSEQVRNVMQKQLERYESDKVIGALTDRAHNRVREMHPDLF
jgi:hypothetical protein